MGHKKEAVREILAQHQQTQGINCARDSRMTDKQTTKEIAREIFA